MTFRALVGHGADWRGVQTPAPCCLNLQGEPERWAIVDSNHGPPPYQSGALTN